MYMKQNDNIHIRIYVDSSKYLLLITYRMQDQQGKISPLRQLQLG